MRHEVFELIDQRERAVWERWPNELDREKAVTDGSNLRTSDPFLVAWDTAFKAAFGEDEPRGPAPGYVKHTWNIFVHVVGSKAKNTPNGIWTIELDELA